jgi:neogenin
MDGSALKYDTRRYQLQNGSLYFESVEHSRSHRPDSGLYQCAARLTTHGTILSRPANLTIAFVDPSFLIEPKDVVVSGVGEVAMFVCYLRGTPWPQTQWYHNGDIALNDDDHYVIHNVNGESVLEILGVGPNDAGRYQCESGNGIDPPHLSRFARLTLNSTTVLDTSTGRRGVVPNFVLQPRDSSTVEGSTILLYCGANGHDRHGSLPRIVWLKDGTLLDVDIDQRLSIRGQGTLTISDVTTQDAGAYTCRATNAEDSLDAVAYLQVKAAPHFHQKLSDTIAQVHSDVTFECDIQSSLSPIAIEWLKNGDVVSPSNYFRIEEGGRKLRILGLVSSDAGMYQCMASNEVTTVQSSARLTVLLKGPSAASRSTNQPTGSNSPRDLTSTATLSTSVTLTWLAPHTLDSISGYVIYWQEAGSQRERSLNTSSPGVTIDQLKPSTQYVFQVAAVTNTGLLLDKAEITVETQAEVEDALPSVPTNLRATAISPTSLHVTWDAPAVTATSSMTLYYRLYYYDVNADVGDSAEMDVTSIERDVTLTDLCKYCEYSLRVVAYSSDGPSDSSEELLCRTLSDVPSAVPHNVTLEPVSSTSIAVSWEPPPDGTRNGIITGYKIRYKPRGDRSGGEMVTTDGSRRSHELTGLDRATEYSVRIQAVTVNGSGPATSWLNAETFAHDLDESVVPGKPTSLRVRPLATSVVVSWTPPVEQDIMIRGYILGYGVGIPDVFRQVLTPRQRYHTVKSLRPSSEYVISLRAFNNVGEGIPIYETTVTREETTPEPPIPLMPPVGVHATVLSSNVIIVSWSDSTSAAPVDGSVFTVRYGQRPLRGRYRYVNVTSTSAHIDDLRPDTEYEMSVKVSRGVRQSTWSMSVFVRTKEAAPSTSPRDVTPSIIDRKPTSVTLSWQPPRHSNGQITGYVVYYTTDSTRRDTDWVVESVNGDRLSTAVRDLRPDTTYYFKVAARNKVGYGPVSPTVIFHTPYTDGTGGGMIETPDDQKPVDMDWALGSWAYGTTPTFKGGADASTGFPPFVLWIVVGGAGGVLVIVTIIIVAVVFRCRRQQKIVKDNENDKRRTSLSMTKQGPRDVNPPDLWIHGNVEVDKISDIDETTSMTQRPSSRGNHSDRTTGGRSYECSDDDRYSSLRQPPMMLTPTLHEPLMSGTTTAGGMIDSQSQRGSLVQPTYQRLHYSSAPRVSVGNLSLTNSSGGKIGRPSGIASSFKTTSPPPTAAAVIFSSRPPSSPRRYPSSSTYMSEFSPISHRIDSYKVPEDVDAEELKTEIAGIEGLMKDLSAITQRQLDT